MQNCFEKSCDNLYKVGVIFVVFGTNFGDFCVVGVSISAIFVIFRGLGDQMGPRPKKHRKRDIENLKKVVPNPALFE